MKVSRKERIRGFYEYMYWSAVDAYNKEENAKAREENRPSRHIMASEGRKLHADWEKALANDGYSLDDAERLGVSRVMARMNGVLQNRIGHPVFTAGPKEDRTYARMIAQYKTMTGQVDGAEYVEENDVKHLVMDENHFMPVSPYDDRYSSNSAVLDNGSRLGGIPGDAPVEYYEETADMNVARHVPYAGNLHEDYDKKENTYSWKSSAYGEDGPQLVSEDDVVGISRLKGFMTTDEYNKVRDWAVSGMNPDDMTPAMMAARKRGIDRSVAILSGLQAMGQDYTIAPDLNRGQISANITGTRIRIRVTDTPQNAKYVGKVYDDGSEVRFKSTYRAYDPKTKKSGYVMVEPTPEDSLNLVRFALGEPVVSADGRQVGEVGQSKRRVKSGQIDINKAYHTKDSFFAEYGKAKDQNGNIDNRYGNVVRISMSHTNRSDATTPMATESDADRYLRESIASARENYAADLDVDRLLSDWSAHHEEEGYEPTLSENPDIAVIQQSYLDVLEGRKATLLRPDYSQEDFDERISEVGEFETDSAVYGALYTSEMSQLTYPATMDAQHMVRQHAKDIVDHDIGSYERDASGKRFNPAGVAAHMSSAYSPYRNNDDIVKAMRMLDISKDEVKGDDFYNKTVMDKLAKFDYGSSERMADRTSSFMQSMYAEIRDSLAHNGVDVKNEDDIRIDKNGIIHYAGYVHTGEQMSKENGATRIEGEIGQIFEPESNNVVYTHFNSGQDYAFVPGYEAHIRPQVPGETKTVEERTRLVGYEQAMRQRIRYTLRQDLVTAGNRQGVIGETTSLNSTYSHLYDERHDVDFMQQYREQGMSDETLDVLIKTESQRVRYPNTIRDGSTIHAEYMASNGFSQDLENDNSNDAFVLTGGRNMSVLTAEADGYFDPIATTATSTNQGCLRYLVDGAHVNADGSITPSADKYDRCAVMHSELMKYADDDPFDRQNMTLSNLLDASSVTGKTNTALMPFGGWNMDDGIVVSKHFAETHNMRNRDGHMRNLVVGDKMSDLHGNKGVISLIVDPDMPADEAKAKGISDQVAWFKENPDLDVVMAPFSAPSRFNGGTGREMMAGDVKNLTAPDGRIVTGAMSQMSFIITNKAADSKTHVYDDDEVAAGNGRKASAQLAWALNAKDASAIMKECYGRNGTAFANARELFITCGLDISETGEIRRGYVPHAGEKRNVIQQPEMSYLIDKNGKRMGLDRKALRAEFADIISRQGGVLEVPFEMKYPTGDPIPPLNDGKTDVVYTEHEWERKGYTRKDGVYVRPTTVHRRIEAGQRQTGDVTYGLPVMSSYLRSGQQFADGSSTTHDYTHQYEDIFIAACEYRDAQERKAHPELYTERAASLADSVAASAQKTAQARYDRITNDIKTRSFSGKHNIFRDSIMSHRMPNSATAIWSEDPRLNLDEIAVGRAMADSIGIKDGGGVMVWRDPILRDGGLRYMKAKIDDSLTGVAINPAMDKCFDGDFDGDTVGIVNLQTRAAQREAAEKFSVGANLLDYGHKDAEGKYDLYLQDGLDVKAAMHEHPELAERMTVLRDHINSFESMGTDGTISAKELADFRKEAVSSLSDVFHDALKTQTGSVAINYDNPKNHIRSIHAACVETGAKGNTKKVVQYGKWMGLDTPMKSDGTIDYDGIRDTGHTLATRDMQQQVMYATAVKSFGTGIAGSFSQRAVSAMRNDCQKAVLELTYPVTQSLLQSKHDAAEAKAKYDMLMGPVRHLWRGESMVYDDEKKTWSVERGADGKPVPATKDEWKQTFMQMYTSPTDEGGLNVSINEDYVNTVADHMSKDNLMMDIESDTGREATAPLDRLAYGGTFEDIVALADEHKNLFDGRHNAEFAPNKVQINWEAVQQVNDEAEAHLKTFSKQDVVESGHVRNTSHGKSVAVGERKLPDVGCLDDNGNVKEQPAGDDQFGNA